MKLIKLTLLLTFFLTVNNIKSQIAFTASSLSANITNGTEAVEINFVVNKDSLVLPNNLTYNDITFFQIEKTDGGVNARMINTITKTTNITSFTFLDTEVGINTQEYQLLAVDNKGISVVIESSSVFLQPINQGLNCVKINHLYRMACHNCFENLIA